MEALQIVSKLRHSLELLYGPRLLRTILFGSHARGEAGPESDIDVLVVLRGEVNPGDEIRRTGDVISQLSLAHNVSLSCVFMDEDRFLHRHGPLLRNIRKEGIAA